jgi:rare lipoprotein A
VKTFRYLAGFLAIGVVAMLVSCKSEQPRVDDQTDGPSLTSIKASDVADAVPVSEPRARYGNHSPYEVFGKKYSVMPSSEGYHKKGVASWYGSKFHGRRTSSGEPYDMHLATAAHKTLPLPTYAEVTNLDNGKKVIVKINDRGPFKDDRLIDMSYGAALRLGMTGTGTARVDVRVIDVSNAPRAVAYTAPNASADVQIPDTWLQTGAYKKRGGAEQLARKLEQANLNPVSINESGKWFRVWLGPYTSSAEVESVISEAIELGFERPHRVRR